MFLLTDEPLPFGELALFSEDYQEFACSKATVTWLQAGGMTSIDGRRVTTRIVDDFGPNVMVGYHWETDAR